MLSVDNPIEIIARGEKRGDFEEIIWSGQWWEIGRIETVTNKKSIVPSCYVDGYIEKKLFSTMSLSKALWVGDKEVSEVSGIPFRLVQCTGMPCSLEAGSMVNWHEVDTGDFGEYEENQTDEPYSCSKDWRAYRKPEDNSILEKYGLTLEQWIDIGAELESVMSISMCGMCV
jgi:hypothetical protein